MSVYEFKMVPAPLRPVQKKVRHPAEDGFCVTLTEMVNEMAADGWEYVRCEALPGPSRGWKFWKPREERQVFVFRRLRDNSNLLPSPESMAAGQPLIPTTGADLQPQYQQQPHFQQQAQPMSDHAVRQPSRAVSRRPPSVQATTPRPQSVVVPPPVPGRSASHSPRLAEAVRAAAPDPQPQQARPPMAPEGVSLEVNRRVSDAAAVQRVKAGARRVSVRPQLERSAYAQ